MGILICSALKDFLDKINAKVGGYLWAILAAVLVLLFVILCMVIHFKNKRIKKLKAQLKATRTELEMERTRANNEQMFAPVTGSKEIFGETAEIVPKEEEDDGIETVEIDEPDDSEPIVTATAQSSTERLIPKISYYDRTSVVSSKSSSGANAKYIVKYDRNKDSWVIKKEGMDRVVRRVDTKEEAMQIARALCKKNNASLVVHKKDGKFQKL